MLHIATGLIKLSARYSGRYQTLEQACYIIITHNLHTH